MAKVRPGMFISERYEIVSLIGSGGTAEVFKAKDHRLNRFVAIKILKENFTGDRKIVEKFRQEAQASAGLTHPNIVSVYDVGNAGDLHYIVMELIDGITLKKFIERKGRLDIKEAIGIAIQIAQGLDAAHANHIVHRDIKPQNIIISREGKVKVSDFGIARATFGTSSNTLNQAPVGSVHYLSPEQARGGFSDERSDIYSLGVTIYEMLAGKVPFSGDNNVSVALLHIQGEARPLHEINPEVTPAIEKIVVKCMQKKPERRYFSAKELIDDLKLSLKNPKGDFVTLGKGVPVDAPTINMTGEELDAIRTQAHANEFEDPDEIEEDLEVDDEDIDAVGTKTEKFVIIGSVVLVVLVILLVVFLAKNIMDSNNESSSKAESLTSTQIEQLKSYGYTTEEMEKLLKEKYNFSAGDYKVSTIYDADVEEGYVIDMYYNTDGVLIIESSLGVAPADQVIMPDLYGDTEEEAREKLAKLSEGFDLDFVLSATHSDEEEGTVIAQSVEEGKSISMDATIEITLSIGPDMIAIPDFTSVTMTKEEIEANYSDSFTITYKYDDNNKETTAGIAVRSDPEALDADGKEVKLAKGSELVVYLSSELVEVPDVSGKTLTEAKNALAAVGLKANPVSQAYDGTHAAEAVLSQGTDAGDTVARGSAVTITYNAAATPTPTFTPTPKADTPTPTPTTGAEQGDDSGNTGDETGDETGNNGE